MRDHAAPTVVSSTTNTNTNSPPTLTTNSRPRTPHEPRTAISSSDQQSPSLRRLEFINRATVDSIASRIQTEGRAMASNLLGWTAVGRPSRERSTRIPAGTEGPL
jgi:hypothetical protein